MTDAPEWKKIKDEIVYPGSHRAMKEKTFIMPNGESRTYEIQSEPSCAVVMCVTIDGKVLVHDRFMPGPETDGISFPGGHIDLDEGLEDAAKREVMEETGYAPEKLVFLKKVRQSPYGELWEQYFIALGCTPVTASDHDDPELHGLRRITLAELYEQTFNPASAAFEHVQCAALGIEYMRKNGLWKI